VRKAHGKRKNCRSRVLLVFGDTLVGRAARTTRDPVPPFRTTGLTDAGAALAPTRLCARRSPHSLARLDFRILRMLSQDETLPLRNWSAFLAGSGYWQPLSQ